jgi:hypothetical protein
MTLLQRAVIRRLDVAGLTALSNEAQRYWSSGHRGPDWHIEDPQLRADYEKANGQVSTRPD